MPTLDGPMRDALLQAAVCDSYDPLQMVVAADARDALLQQLARDSTEIESDGVFRWALLPEARQRILATASADELHRAAQRYGPADALASHIAAVLAPGDTALQQGDDYGLRYRAVEMLRTALGEAAGPALAVLQQQSSQLRTNLGRQAAERALDSVTRTALRGRNAELDLLHAFVENGPPALESTSAAALQDGRAVSGAKSTSLHRAPPTPRRWAEVQALLLSGIGGAGKSAMLAELIRRERGTGWNGRVVIHFDFDDPALKIGQQGAMTLALARQLTLARPALGEALSESRARLRDVLRRTGRSSGAYEELKFNLAAEFSLWRPLLAAHQVRELLFVLDTLEEVTVVDFARLDGLFGWLDSMRIDTGLETLRVIGSGRALVGEESAEQARLWPYFLAELALGDLQERPAREMLCDRFLHYGSAALMKQASRCVETFGGNPLVLSVLARYCAEKDSAALGALLHEAEREGRHGLYGQFAQRFLNQRILERLRDPDIQPLVAPGLILRRVTPTLIREVLAGPCGLGEVSPKRAQQLLDKLQRLAWLVTADGEGVRHRSDMRRQMLPLVMEQHPQRAREINLAASRWYQQQSAAGVLDTAELEARYHQGLLGQVPEDVVELSVLGNYLGQDVDDLPPAVRGAIKAVGGRALSVAEENALSPELRTRLLAQRHRVLAGEGQASLATAKMEAAAREGQLPLHTDANEAVADQWQSVTEAEVLKAQFDAGDFETVARANARVLASYYADGPAQAVQAENVSNDPAYLSALAVNAFVPELKKDVHAYSPQASGTVRGYRFPAGPALRLLVAIDTFLWRTLDSPTTVAALKEHLAAAGPDRKSDPDWRCELRLASAFGEGLFPVPLRTLPFMHPELVDLLLLQPDPLRQGEPSRQSREVGWHTVVRFLPQSVPPTGMPPPVVRQAGPLALAQLQEVERALGGMLVGVSAGLAWGSGTAFMGLVPELYAPARLAIRQEVTPSALAQILVELTGSLARWPPELAPAQFEEASADRYNELIPILIQVADYFGCLFELVRCAGAAAAPQSRLDRVARLFATFEDAWRM